jgi:hypothetical protein
LCVSFLAFCLLVLLFGWLACCCSLACLLARLPACLHACLLACSAAYLFESLFARFCRKVILVTANLN